MGAIRSGKKSDLVASKAKGNHAAELSIGAGTAPPPPRPQRKTIIDKIELALLGGHGAGVWSQGAAACKIQKHFTALRVQHPSPEAHADDTAVKRM